MKETIKNSIFLFVSLLITSCTWGLEDIESSDECEISNFTFEKRYVEKEERTTSDEDGNVIDYTVEKVLFEAVSNKTIAITGTNINITVPNDTDLTNIVGLATISTGATISPLDGSPKLGERADFSQPRKYRVTAADNKTTKDWIISVNKE